MGGMGWGELKNVLYFLEREAGEEIWNGTREESMAPTKSSFTLPEVYTVLPNYRSGIFTRATIHYLPSSPSYPNRTFHVRFLIFHFPFPNI